MKKFLSSFLCIILLACNNDKTESKATATINDSTAKSGVVDLPYTASYSSNFTTDVSDADLKTVIQSYKDWADGNLAEVGKALSDTLLWDRTSGEHVVLPAAGIMNLWTTYRDSLSSVVIDMQAWHKMYEADKKMGWVAVWYKEIDTYKSGKVDSAYYHDLNLLKDGKIRYLQQYKRAAK